MIQFRSRMIDKRCMYQFSNIFIYYIPLALLYTAFMLDDIVKKSLNEVSYYILRADGRT